MEHSRSDEFDRELERIWREAATTRSPLPTELELAKALGVSRPMVREALVKLEAQGLIARRAHQGTFANVVALSVPFRIDQSYELTERLVQVGYEVKVDVVRAEWSTLRNDEADDLEATPGMPCFRVVKRWLANGRPLILAEDVVPARRRDDIEFGDEYSIFESVKLLRGVPVEWESAKLKPVLPDSATQELLAVGPQEPLLTISLVGVSLHGERLYRGHETHVADGPEYGMVRRSTRST